MSNKATATPVKKSLRQYIFPEKGLVVEADTLAEATELAQKLSKESEK